MDNENSVLSNSTRRRALGRWMLLKKALLRERDSESVRNVGPWFDLFLHRLPIATGDTADRHTEDINEYIWDRIGIGSTPVEVAIRMYKLHAVTGLEDLKGFNNTGNVSIWPSEDVLSQVVHTRICSAAPLQNVHTRLIELGGGMSSLAGLAMASIDFTNSYNLSSVILTDGNDRSVDNIVAIIEENRAKFKAREIVGRKLWWGDISSMKDLLGTCDWVIAADCFFFEDCHNALLDTIVALLRPQSGFCIMVAPRRGNSLNAFVSLAKARPNVSVSVFENFDELLNEKVAQCRAAGQLGDPDKELPLLVQMHLT